MRSCTWPALAGAGPNARSSAGPSEQRFYDVVTDPRGRGLNIFLGMKLFFLKLLLFSCIAVDFILRSFLLTHIEIVILTTKKYFLHRALLFLL